jgi:hypothetical protein
VLCLPNTRLYQSDVKSAFLSGKPLNETIYMEQPHGFVTSSTKVCHLKKGLYGLRQAPRLWQARLREALKKAGFVACKNDDCVYVLRKGGAVVYLLTNVDDLTYARSNTPEGKALLDAAHASLKKEFVLTKPEPIDWFLGVRVQQSKNEVRIDQGAYIRQILDKFGMTDAAPAPTPMTQGIQLTAEQGPVTTEERKEMSKVPYRQAVGSLLYLTTCTRPDIAYAVHTLARYQLNPGLAHWRGVKRVFRYLAGTKDLALVFTAGAQQAQFVMHSDASWLDDVDSRGSTVGFVVKMAGAAVGYGSKLTRTKQHSSFESELISADLATRKWLYFIHLLDEMGLKLAQQSVLCIDNKGTIDMVNNGSRRGSRHIDMRKFFIRDQVLSGDLVLSWVSTDDQLADIFTKALPVAKFTAQRGQLIGDSSARKD